MITAQDLFRLAARLAAASSADEAQLRAAISRAYYSAFHLAKEYLASLGAKLGNNDGEVQRFLLECGHPRAQIAGRRLTDLHSFRIKADYDLRASSVGTPGVARQCVELANDIDAVLKELNAAADRQQIKSGIEAYRRKIGRT